MAHIVLEDENGRLELSSPHLSVWDLLRTARPVTATLWPVAPPAVFHDLRQRAEAPAASNGSASATREVEPGTGTGPASAPCDIAAEGSSADVTPAEEAPAPAPAPAPGRRFTCTDCHDDFPAAPAGPLPKRCPSCAHQHRVHMQQQRRAAEIRRPTVRRAATPAPQAEPDEAAAATVPPERPAATAAKPWRCGDCPETFATKDQLAHHRLTHGPQRPKVDRALVDLEEESRPFACDFCDRTFRYGHEVAHHVRVQHTTTAAAPTPPPTAPPVPVRAGEDRQAVTDRLDRALAIAKGRAS